MAHDLVVALGDIRYRVERPFGAWPPNSGFVTDVTVDGRGHVFVMLRHDPLVHPADPRVVELDPEGRYITGWGGEGHDEGQFVWPHAIWAFADGRVVVVDRTWNRVQVFDGEGRHLQTWHDFYQPVGIWGDGEGCAYVTDMVPSLTRIAPDGTRIGRCRPMLNGAHGLFGTPAGDILLAEGNPSRITRLRRLPAPRQDDAFPGSR
ncbi:MAG: hypothetical protein ACK4M0_09000 [Phreatobacter sp.]